MTLIYVGDSILDLSPGTIVAITVQRFDVFNPSSRYVSSTNEIVAPPTANNLSIFELQSDKSLSTKVYSTLECRVVQNGYEVISYGKLFCTRVEKGLRIQIYDSDVDSFSLLKTQTLNYIVNNNGYSFGDSVWNSVTIESVRNNTTGIVAPYLNWGNGFDTLFYWPLFYYSNYIKSICTAIGVSPTDISGSNALNSDVAQLALANVSDKLEYTSEISEVFDMTAVSSGTQSLAASGDITFITSVTSEGSVDIYDQANGRIACPSNTAIELNVSYTINGSITNTDAVLVLQSRVRLTRNRGGVFTYPFTVNYSVAPLTTDTIIGKTLSATIEVIDGDLIYLTFDDQGFAPMSLFLSSATMYAKTTTRVYKERLFFDYLITNTISPLDFMKDWLVRFGVIFKVDETGYLRIKKLNDILADTGTSIDWTTKRSSDVSTDFTNGFALNNYYQYSDNTETTNRGRGSLQLAESPKDELVKFTSVFKTADTLNDFGVNCAKLNLYESDSADFYDIRNAVPFTLLTVRDKLAEEPSVTYSGVVTSYKVAYFEDSTITRSTSFQYFIDNYYSILENSLQNNKIVKRFYNLTEKDIFEYDPFKMIYDNGEYYLVNKIENFVPGQLTRVELFRV